MRRGDVERDRDLLRALSTNKAEGALEQIVRKHGPMVMGVCRRVLSHHDAEDAFQATFIVLVRKHRSLVLRTTLGAWLHGVALRTAMKAKGMRKAQDAAADLTADILASGERDPSERAAWSEIGPILDDEIQRLPKIMRAAVVLCELEGRTHRDAAKELGIPVGTLSARLARAKEKLRSRLTRRGLTITTAGLTAALSAQATTAALSTSQISAAVKVSTLVLAGKSASLTTTSAVALALANAIGRKMFMAKALTASTAVVLLVAATAAGVFLPARGPDLVTVDAQFSDRLMTAERAVMHLGEEAFRHRFGASRIAYIAGGNKLATISPYNPPHSVYLWDATTGEKLWEYQGPYDESAWPRCLAAPPSGAMLAVGLNNGEVSVLDAETGSLLYVEQRDVRPITAIAFAPDGSRLVTANMDGVVRVSSANDLGRELRTWRAVPTEQLVPDDFIGDGEDNRGPRASVMAISPDGERIAIGDGAIGAIYICDTQSGERLTTIEKAHGRRLGYPYSCVNTLRFTMDGRQLFSGGYRMAPKKGYQLEIRLWDVETGGLVRDLVDAEIVSEGFLAISPDRQSFATTDYGRVLHLWNMGDGASRHSVPIPGHSHGEAVAFSPDGMTVAVPTGKGITLWDTHTAQRKFHKVPPRYSDIREVAWSNTTAKLAIGYTDGIELRDANNGKLEYRFDMTEPGVEYEHPPALKDLAFSADSQILVAAGTQTLRSPAKRYGLIKAWDAFSGDQRASIRVDRAVWTMALADDASVVAVTTSYGNPKDTQLFVYELPSGKLLGQYPKEIDSIPNNGIDGFERAVAARIPPGSTKVYMVCEDNFCFHWDFVSHEVGIGFFADERTDGRACGVRSAVFTPDAKTLVTSGYGKICVWNTKMETLEHMEVIADLTHWLELGISGDGRRFAGAERGTVGRDDVIRVWDLPSRTLTLKWQTPNARATSFAFSPDNSKLLTGLDRGTAMIWDVQK